MKMAGVLFLLTFSTLGGASASCSAAGDKNMHLTGKLVYQVSDTIDQLDLISLEKRSIYQHGGLIGDGITRVSDKLFVFSDFGHQMYLVTIGDGVRKLAQGSAPIYFPKHRKLLFYGAKPGQRGPRLYEAGLENDVLATPKEIDAGPFGTAPPVVPISDDEGIFLRASLKEYRLFKYNLRNGETTELPIRRRCRPVAWRSATKQLVCENELPEVFLASLEGQIVDLPALRHVALSVYVPTVDALLGSRGRVERGAEVRDLVLYDFSNGTLRKVTEHVPIGVGSAFWTE